MTTDGIVSLNELVAEAEAGIELLAPSAALEAMEAGAALVDIRSRDARREHGVVPGSVHIPRTVLEWRLEPGGDACTPHVDTRRQRVVLLCDHGCSTSLAALNLARMGVRAGHVVGGFAAWLESGLPVCAAADAPYAAGERPGMRGADVGR
jgi:rhodanese-related sulfurtransferase